MAKEEKNLEAFGLLKKAIREKAVGNLYFFYGEEAFLRQYYLDQIRKMRTDALTEAFNFHRFTAENFSVQAFSEAVEAMPMMAEFTFVWVDDVDIFKLPEDERTKLTELFSDMPEYCTVVFTYETVPWKPDKRLKKLWDAASTCGTVVEFPKQEQRDLIPWIGRHFAAAGKRISPNLSSYLITLTGGTMTALVGEISKICAFSSAEEITKYDIDTVVEPVLDAVIFQMTDYIGSGRCAEALQKLGQLLKMQEAPLAILGAMGAHFRRLATAHTLQENGKQAGDLRSLCNLQEYPARKAMESARHFSSCFYAFAAEQIMETDRKLKTSYDDPKRLLEALVIALTQEAQNA